jgi:glyoxylase-like metal-dependent hydrolase (beta-lactamase superfamily II)
MKQVTDNVFVEIDYMGCNPGFVTTSEGIVMIDTPQRPTDSLSYRSEIETRGSVRYLINTEPHMDHCTGNFFFSAPCIAHEGTRKALESASLEEVKERIRQIDPDYASNLNTYSVRLPEIIFNRGLTLYVGDHELECIHLPGHTASEIAIHIPKERVVFTGDNIFHKLQAYLHEALPGDWLESLERLKRLDVDVYIPGHGEPCKRAYLDEQAGFIRDWVSTVKEAVGKGWSLEEALERISLLDRYPMSAGREEFGPELQRMNITRLYELAGENQL